MEPVNLKVLLVEDSEDDAELLVRELRRGGYLPHSQRVETPEAMARALAEEAWDAVISDFNLPGGFDSLQALAILRASGQDLPFIVVSGAIGELRAVELMKAGAHDYVPKDNLARLVPSLRRELRDAAVRREHQRAQEQIEQLNRDLREFAQRLLRAQEEERRRVAAELHDGLHQLLVAIKMQVDLQQSTARERALDQSERLQQLAHLCERAVAESRRVVDGLRPQLLDELGLVRALGQHLREVAALNARHLTYQADQGAQRLDAAGQTIVFRIVQEAVSNAVKYTRGGVIAVRLLEAPGVLRVEVQDDGPGFDEEQVRQQGRRGLGLLSMRERAELGGGRLTLASSPETGTTVTAELPLPCAAALVEA